MANLKYTAGKEAILKGLIDLTDTAKVKVMLVTSAYVAAATVADAIATVQAGDIGTGGGYTALGELLTGNAVTIDGSNNAKFDAANYTWATSTITAGGAVIWYDDVTDYPICLVDFGGDKSSSNGDFTINWDAAGILTMG